MLCEFSIGIAFVSGIAVLTWLICFISDSVYDYKEFMLEIKFIKEQGSGNTGNIIHVLDRLDALEKRIQRLEETKPKTKGRK
jgi:hypothetical protein